MADVTTSQVIANGPRNLIIKLTDVSDGTGLSGVKVVDAQSATYAVHVQGQSFVPGIHLKVKMIEYEVYAGWVRLQWDASVPVDLDILTPGTGRQDYTTFQGLPNPAPAGATGSILLTTVNWALNSAYMITLHMIKGVPQS